MATPSSTAPSCSVEVFSDYDGIYQIVITFKRGQTIIGYSEIDGPDLERLFHFGDALRKGDNYELFEKEECVDGNRSLNLTQTHITYHQSNYKGHGSNVGGSGGAVKRAKYGPLLLEELRRAKIYY